VTQFQVTIQIITLKMLFIFQLLALLDSLFEVCLTVTLAVGCAYWLVWLVSLTVPHHHARYNPTWVELTMRDIVKAYLPQNKNRTR
tara:strand:+ start:457 stop:714 length:258 start_codon:yes stop_codon:yes gene_type:complete